MTLSRVNDFAPDRKGIGSGMFNVWMDKREFIRVDKRRSEHEAQGILVGAGVVKIHNLTRDKSRLTRGVM